MNKIKYINKLLILLSFTVVVSLFMSCSSNNPQNTVKNFFDAIGSNKIDTAILYTTKSNEMLSLKDFEKKKVVHKLFSLLKYQVLSSNVNGTEATVNVKIISPDLSKIAKMAYNDILKKATEGKEGSQTDYKAIAEQYYLDKLSDKNVEMISSEVSMKLVKDKGWVIEGNKDLLNALLGNFINSSPNSETNNVKQ